MTEDKCKHLIPVWAQPYCGSSHLSPPSVTFQGGSLGPPTRPGQEEQKAGTPASADLCLGIQPIPVMKHCDQTLGLLSSPILTPAATQSLRLELLLSA